ncbi:hypothetical protein Poly51_35580 [Rubripirellula tenax]|uniref:Uncharacterized protein n=1 Tax=Rubripirellula tenax TaxID=2528015 RepID=A0A5C6F4U1_9BACT|nr:hypothetical protein Poly51_35580 [Rubripirellula tenax]
MTPSCLTYHNHQKNAICDGKLNATLQSQNEKTLTPQCGTPAFCFAAA